MSPGVRITSSAHVATLATLPWNLPLEDWPERYLSGLPRGISRHVVRFVSVDGDVVAVKETQQPIAQHEYDTLKALNSLDVPCVRQLGIVTNRFDDKGEPLPSALLTQHLPFSLPYRALFSRKIDGATGNRLVDALAVLLVRLHLVGFFWGDVSLSNTLFRRDADAFAAYLVDAETGELHQHLSDGQRHYDLDLATTNIIGEFMDLQAGGLADPEVDPIEFSTVLVDRYTSLWTELTRPESFSATERWRVDDRMRRLNALGFDIGELAITTDVDGVTAHLEPKVVEPGHHRRRLLRLAGIDSQENQARRLLNDLDSYRNATGQADVPEEQVALRWLREVFDAVVEAVPREWRGRREPAQVFHEFLDHRWLISEQQQRDVPLREAIRSYLDNVLSHAREEASYIRRPGAHDTETIELPRLDPDGATPRQE